MKPQLTKINQSSKLPYRDAHLKGALFRGRSSLNLISEFYFFPFLLQVTLVSKQTLLFAEGTLFCYTNDSQRFVWLFKEKTKADNENTMEIVRDPIYNGESDRIDSKLHRVVSMPIPYVLLKFQVCSTNSLYSHRGVLR